MPFYLIGVRQLRQHTKCGRNYPHAYLFHPYVSPPYILDDTIFWTLQFSLDTTYVTMKYSDGIGLTDGLLLSLLIN